MLNRSRGKKLFLAAAALSIVTGGIGLYLILNPRQAVSDPGIGRTNWLGAYERAIASAGSTSAVPEEVFGPVTVETNGNQATLTYLERNPGSANYNAGFERIGDTQKVKVEDGAIYLKYLAVAWDVVKTNFDYSARLPGKFYKAPELQSIALEEVQPKLEEWDKLLEYRGSFPQVRFYFGVTNLTNFLVLGMEAYDGRTWGSLTDGYSTSQHEDGFYFEHTVRRWHGGPVELLLHIAHGEPQIFTVPIKTGTEHKLPGRIIKIAAHVPQGSSWSSQSDGITNVVTFRQIPASQTQSAVILLEWPSTHRSPVKFELLDANGKVISTGGGSSGTMRSMRIHGPEQPASLRMTHHPRSTRYLFRLPTIPGMPPENEAIENLLQARVPQMRVEAEWDFERNLEGLLQLDIPTAASGKFPPGYFPRSFTNMTGADLLREYYKFSGVRPQLKIINEAGKAEFIQPPWQQVLNKFIAWFEK